MPLSYDGTGVKINTGAKDIPEGDYVLRIVKAELGMTKNGDDKVTVEFEIAEGEQALESIKNHVVTFFKDKASKGAGMTLHFLKCIGEPWEGAFDVDERNWVGKRLKGHVAMELVTQGKFMGKKFPKVKYVEMLGEGANPSAEGVPF